MNTAGGLCFPKSFWLKWLAAFLGALVVGMLLAFATRPVAAPPPPPNDKDKVPPKIDIACAFRAFDTKGNEIDATPLNRLTKKEGEQSDMVFTRKDNQTAVKERVVWRKKAEHLKWLEGEFKATLGKLDKNYDKAKWDRRIAEFKSNTSDAAYDYPIVFPPR